jgi:AcrR family transcriptional regulator
MAPRKYTQHGRADSTAATRQRIIDATIDAYRERGIPATTLKAVADRADVSRGTILHHFGSADGLLGAVLNFVLDSIELPNADEIRKIERRDARVRRFVEGMLDMQDRTSHWWPIFEAEMGRPELQQREAEYWAIVADLQAATLGPVLGADPVANATLLSIVHPATVGTFNWAFERAGLSGERARPLLIEVAVDAVRRVADGDAPEGGAW